MAIRVWTAPHARANGQYVDYEDAAGYRVDAEHELDVLASSGSMVATYAPGCWHHVETRMNK